MATATGVTFKDLRCSCNKLFAKVSSTSSARIETKCGRCHTICIFQVSTGAR